MASVRDEVLRMLTEYPSIFPNKSACFRHLFLVNGNGYDWVDGELVSWSAKSAPDFKNEDEAVEEHAEKFGRTPLYEKVFGEEQFGYIRLETRMNNLLIQFAIDNIDLIMKSEMISFGSSLHYSGWDYCLLMQVPEDVKPDWLEAVNDCRHALIPFVYQAKQMRHYMTTGIDDLDRDLTRLKTERFSEEFKRDAEMADMVKDILAEIKDEEKD